MRGSGPNSLTGLLEAFGVRHAFGLPGTQNVALFEELRTSPIRTVLATSELAASFMAVGYGRASGEPGVLVTIPGPGFAYALPGLAEARLDSVPLLHLVVHNPAKPGKRFRHQEIPLKEMAGPLVKAVVEIDSADRLPDLLSQAWESTREGEPGPVTVFISVAALEAGGPTDPRDASPGRAADTGSWGGTPRLPGGRPPDPAMRDLLLRVQGARRPVLFLGLGSLGAASRIEELLDRLTAPFFTTPSARGVVPEDHPLCLGFDFDRGGLTVLNGLLGTADLILALGCKLGYNGTGGFRLELPAGQLVHVNADAEALGANYATSLSLCEGAEAVVEAILGSMQPAKTGPEGSSESPAPGSLWTPEEVSHWRSRIAAASGGGPVEPLFSAGPTGTVRELVEMIREALPRDAILVTDSGLHQTVVRRHFQVLSPRGLILPTDFQSMGFGLPAAIGTALAVSSGDASRSGRPHGQPSAGAPHTVPPRFASRRKVVAVIGDGGLCMSGMELLTLAREKLPITVFVLNDGYLNLIRLQQEREFGYAHAVELRNPDMEALADAVGIDYFRLDSEVESRLQAALALDRPALVEVPLGDSSRMRAARGRGMAKAVARKALGQGRIDRLKEMLRRFRR